MSDSVLVAKCGSAVSVAPVGDAVDREVDSGFLEKHPVFANAESEEAIELAGYRAATVRECPWACDPPKRMKARVTGVVESSAWIAPSTERAAPVPA